MEYFFLVLWTFKTKNLSTYFLVLLAIRLYKTNIRLSVNYRPSLQSFPFYVFPLFQFFNMDESIAAAEGQSTKQTENATFPAIHDEEDPGPNTPKTMLLILTVL